MPDVPTAQHNNSPTPSVGRGGNRRWFVGPVVALSVGLLLGFAVRTLHRPEAAAEEGATTVSELPAADHEQPVPPTTDRQRIDDWITAGDFRQAYRLCRELVTAADGHADDGLCYRLGLCAEGLDRWQEASEVLEPLARRSEQTRPVVAARLARARCLIRSGLTIEARLSVVGLALSANQLPWADPEMIGEVFFLLAELAQLSLPPDEMFGPSELSGPGFVRLQTPVERCLAWADPAPTQNASASDERVTVTIPPGELALMVDEMTGTDRELNPRLDRAESAWTRALAAAPGHPGRRVAGLNLGNLAFRRGRLRDAAQWYDRVLQERANDATTVRATYNLGLTHFRRGDFDDARRAFVRAVDCDADGEWTTLAWWWVGRTYLDRGQSQLAIRPFRRGVAAAGPADARALSAVGLAAACLLEGDAAAACTALRSARRHLLAEPCRSAAAFLDAYARSALGGSRAKDDPTADAELAEAVLALGDDLRIGPAGVFLLGQAYRQIGLPERMAKLYEAAVPTCRGALAVRMTADLAEHLFASGQWTESRAWFAAVIAEDSARGALARFRLAEIALRAEHADECLTLCRSALAGRDVDRAAVLSLMGRAFERQGDVLQAARCYAGEGPEG